MSHAHAVCHVVCHPCRSVGVEEHRRILTNKEWLKQWAWLQPCTTRCAHAIYFVTKWTGRLAVPPTPSPEDRLVVSWLTPPPGTQVVRAQNKAGAARCARTMMLSGSTWPRDDVDASRSVPSPQVLQHGHAANRCLQAPVERVVLDPLASAVGPDICVDFKPPKAALWQPWGRCGASQSWDAAEPHQAEKVGWRGHRVA